MVENHSPSGVSRSIAYSNQGFLLMVFLIVSMVAFNLFIYYIVYGNKYFKAEAWKNVSQSANVSPGKVITVSYRLEGTIINITSNTISVIDQQGRRESFRVFLALFTITKPFEHSEEWPTAIITANDRSQFKVGDKVTLLLGSNILSDMKKNEFYVHRIIKIVP